jgi:cytochrome oxidase Cu insertion factor (SCO1/SenC/PrrC family)
MFAFVLAAAVLGAAPAFCGGTPEGAPSLVGSVLAHPAPAPDFSLGDQHGTAFRLADARGSVVVLTFIYTHCTDVCPYVAIKVKKAVSLLGADARRAQFIAVTTDPARDTREVTAEYSRAAGLFTEWRFLSGPPGAVEAVWKSFGIGVRVKAPSDDEGAEGPADDGQIRTSGLAAGDLAAADVRALLRGN